MMKHVWLTIGLFCVIILAYGQANAVLQVRAVSPQATADAITLAAADSFHVDIWMKVEDGDDVMSGGKMSYEFYSPDGSITNLTHLAVPAGQLGSMPVSTLSAEFRNSFLTLFSLIVMPFENGWGDGSLPDTVAWDFAGLTGMASTAPDQSYVRFNLRVSNDGILCVGPSTDGGEFDWLLDRPYNFPTQCWTIGDYAPDNPPEITCPSNVNVECGGSTDPSNTGNPTVTDDNDPSPTVIYSDNIAPGSCPTIMVITRTWTATDDKNQSSNCVQTITIVDTTPPTFTNCPGPITVQCETDINPSNTGQATATDGCDDTPNVTYADGAIVAGVFTRTWTANDACGNSSICNQVITISDTTPPTVNCPADMVVSNDAGTCGAAVNFEISATDNCGDVTVVADPESGTVFGLGVTVVSVTATDGSGNSNVCSFNVTVNDTEDPSITCPGPVTLECGADINDPANTGTAAGTDLCDPEVGITYVDAAPIAGVVTRTWTATDNYGNTSTCEQLITLAVDTEDPVFVESCPADITVECDQIPTPADMTATDNCGNATVNFVENITPGACEDSYVIVRTWTASDNSANTAVCVQTITVVDTTDPILTLCPDPMTITCGGSIDPLHTGTPTATDNCSDPIITYIDGSEVEGVFTRTWTIADACGNSITCDQVITIIADTEAPVFSPECPVDIIVECDAIPEIPNITATDNCAGSVDVTFNEQITPGSCEFSYIITRTWTASDDFGNVSNCNQYITVQDIKAPVVTCPDDITVGYGTSTEPDATGFATATDNCDAAPEISYTDGPVEGMSFTRTWTATDICGNASYCYQVITEESMGDPFLIADPESFFFDVTEFDLLEDRILNISERYNRQVQISATSDASWLIINNSFPISTPNVIFFDIDATTILYGDYNATISIISAEAQNSPLEIPVTLHVDPFIPPPDSVWVSTVPAVPGGKAVVPVYFKNNDPLTRVNVPMGWSTDDLSLDSVSFMGTRVEYINDFEKGYTFSNISRQLQIVVDPTFSDNIPGGRGLLARLYFSVSPSAATPTFVALNKVIIPPDGYIYFEDEDGEEAIPVFSSGGVVIDDQAAFVCGSVIEMINGIKTPVEGATVEFWDNFPAGALMTSEITDGNGQFACGTLGIVPFDAYAYKEGYYPGTVSNINFGTLGVEILLSRVTDVVESSSWVLFFSGEQLGGCQSYFYNIPLPVGSVVDAYINGEPAIHCGTFFVTTPGEYSMSVYGDDNQTPEKDGAWEGDEITFFINGYPALTDGSIYWSESILSMEVCFDLFRVDTRIIQLNTGRNLISWNIDTPSDDIESIFAGVMDNVTAILGFEEGGYTYDPMYPEFSTLFYADHLHGYWVEMANPDILILDGSPVSPTTSIELEDTWNLVSYLPDIQHEPAVALENILDNLDVVLGWKGSLPLDYEVANPEYATLEFMEPGYGYWLYMNSAATLNYPGIGPEVIFSQGPAKLNAMKTNHGVETSRFWTNVYSSNLTLDGTPVPQGSEILVVSRDNRIVGSGTVKESGKFGFVPVYGDDPLTEVNEGLLPGESFGLVIDGIETKERFVWNTDSHRIELGELSSARAGNNLMPNHFGLAQNYPNPFNPSTAISFSVPTATNVTLEIFNILGEKVATPFSGMAAAGINEVVWDGKNSTGGSVASGIYFYRMTTDNFEQTRKMVLMK